jgi:signal peptidase complex subunit 1
VTENVYYALYVGLAGLVVTLLAVVPPWPFYNRDPVQWLPASRGAWIGTGQSKKTN